MTKVDVSLPAEAQSNVDAFIDEVDDRLASDEDTCRVVTETLVDLHGDREAYERWQAGEELSPAERVRLQGYDPCNATLESEYYAEKDDERFPESKYLQWLWRQFDATPMADNVGFALQFRAMLANHLFEDCGDNCRFFKGITFTYGHNISVGDNVVIHDDVHLDDRGKLTIGDRASISDDVHLYSHDHDVVDQTEVANYHTIVGEDARVTYDAMVRAGCRIGENAIVGARSVVQGDVPDHHIAAGIPAKSLNVKNGWESVADPIQDRLTTRQEERRIEYDLPADLDDFDEFERELTPPDRS
ncbi:acyltransferase [Halobellus clavatus]|uniref:Transferase hexapeptide (Six repeat-containing protein) n=1 Tax=Halobellus clavatus TaxID=660517 RepID=A0A1H3DKW4_9EURY|nr:acyltransferase [Halobellus clavatus]SDX67133.1 transferase hexapeptide (six repeat-containing protein) [Halobellus clavatus]